MMKAFPPAPEDQVTLANWRTAPHCHWAFHHAREIVPSADIPNMPGAVWDLPDGATAEMPDFEHAGRTVSFADYCTDLHVDALVVLRSGQVVHEHYANGMDRTAPHIIFSVSKSMLGLLAGILSDKGLLDLNAPATTYVPELAGSAFEGATVHNLLDMRSGVFFDEDYLATSGPIVDYRKATNWNPLDPGEKPSDLRSFLPTLTDRTGAHGGAFDYTSPCTDLMGWVLERAAGQRYADLFTDLLWRPMGAETPANITVDRLGAPRCAGGISMTAHDLARVGQMLVEGGRGVVPSDWIKSIAHDGDTAAWDAGSMAPDFPGISMHYRGFWYVLRDRGPTLMCVGIHGQNLLVDLSSGLVMAKFASNPMPMNPDHKQMTLALFEALRQQG
ncbi:MAG: serine hydrolase domain-containing protein [Paracoccaceae bacterium]